MKFSVVLMILAAVMAMGSVTSGSAHYNDASTVNALIAEHFNSRTYEVNIGYEAGAGYSYYVLFDSGSDDHGSTNQAIAAVVSCALVSQSTSWSSAYVVIGYLGNATAWEISTSDARYILNHTNNLGGEWAANYMFSHMEQIL